MQQLHWSAKALFGVAALLHSAYANQVPYSSIFTLGQGYNTFLDKGVTHGAVLVGRHEETKRDDLTANLTALDTNKVMDARPFSFTPPSANMTGIDLKEYFAPLLSSQLDEAAAEPDPVEKDDFNQKFEYNSVLAARSLDKTCTASYTARYKFIQDFNSYLTTLGISASGTISGWGQSASISGDYLDHAQFSRSSLTYLAIIEIKKQEPSGRNYEFNHALYKPDSFHRVFGDSWIRSFETGGKLLARISIDTKDGSNKTDIKAHAEASLKFWGVTANLDSTVKKSMEELDKHANVDIKIFYQGELGKAMENERPQVSSPDENPTVKSFQEIKSLADAFVQHSCDHDYKYHAVLDEYPNLPNFPDQKVLDYSIARKVSRLLLMQLTKFTEFKTVFNRYEFSDDLKLQLDFATLNVTQACKKWVDQTAIEPENALETAKALMDRIQDGYYIIYFQRLLSDVMRTMDPKTRDVFNKDFNRAAHLADASIYNLMTKADQSVVEGPDKPYEKSITMDPKTYRNSSKPAMPDPAKPEPTMPDPAKPEGAATNALDMANQDRSALIAEVEKLPGHFIKVCENRDFTKCGELAPPENRCVNLKQPWKRSISAFSLEKANGVCNFYKLNGCFGPSLSFSAPDVVELWPDHYDYEQEIRSIRCIRHGEKSPTIKENGWIIVYKDHVQSSHLDGHIDLLQEANTASYMGQLKIQVTHRYEKGSHGFMGLAAIIPIELMWMVQGHPGVASVEEDKIIHIPRFFQESEPQTQVLQADHSITQNNARWNLRAISHRSPPSRWVPNLFYKYYYDENSGRNTYAYVIDSGIRITHQGFQGRASNFWTCFPGDYTDDSDHGTYVAGIIASDGYGVAPKAQIFSLKTTRNATTTIADVMSALDAAGHDILSKGRTNSAVINVSLGTAYSWAMSALIHKLSDHGVLVVVASGNQGIDASSRSPGGSPNAITVGSIDPSWRVVATSNYGSFVNILAPGGHVTSLSSHGDSKIVTASGTSAAAPHVAGVILHAMSVDGITSAKMKEHLLATATRNQIRGDLRGSPNLIVNNNNRAQAFCKPNDDTC
ncbi:hypothetical protein CDD81_2218 [Ophiocordyceps australis]|uniref:Peptidase S8/S53 domain-containing protein n=1 Tax=Ophiocordyceps australis TaxID=1399860 RepID=A0A2C5XZ50_9HYPO|nr:hypothetical protein CDD81_2218 [Ophiocordyceps australis]